jgi:prolipoprotein diacylglyceryl transferase
VIEALTGGVPSAALASIPSPPDNTLDLGPLSLHVYGLLIAVGVVVAVKLTMVRWGQRGGDPNEILDGAVVVVISGVIGARAYHVLTDYQRFGDGRWLDAFKVWEGGLAIWGAVLGGAAAVAFLCRRKHVSALVVGDCVVPGLFFAQAIGRFGNWFNQELFGRPTTLPWALEIDLAKRPVGFEQYATFHPTFLYESIYCLVGGIVLLWVDRRCSLRRGQLTALYVILYTFARFFLENLRIDEAHEVLGLRVNAWVSLGFFVFGVAWFVWLGRRPEPADPLRTQPAAPIPQASP